MKKKIIAVIAACAVLCMAGALFAGCKGGDGIFRHKVLQEIALGDSSARVEEVLGVPDEEKEGASFYFEDEYLDLRELELEYNEGIVSPDPNLPFPTDPVSTYPEYVQVVERLQNGKYKSIEIGYAPWGAVEKVICNVGFNRIDMQVKKLKEYSLLDSGYLKGMSVYPLRYTATYEDGSYVLAWANVRLDETGTLGKWTDAFGNPCSAPVQVIEEDAAVSADGQRGYVTAANFDDDAFFEPYRETLRSVTFTGSVESIGAVLDGYSVEEVIVRNEAATAADAFSGCPVRFARVPVQMLSLLSKEKLVELTLTGSGETQADALNGCTALERFTLGAGVSGLGEAPLRDCPALMTITSQGTNEVYLVEDNCLIERETGILLSGTGEAVELSFGTITEIAAGAFEGRTSLRVAILPASVVRIGAGAFRGCNGLEDVFLSETEGWTADGEPLSEEALADNMTAAKYLRETYADCVWERK